jgi:hypothetical protein
MALEMLQDDVYGFAGILGGAAGGPPFAEGPGEVLDGAADVAQFGGRERGAVGRLDVQPQGLPELGEELSPIGQDRGRALEGHLAAHGLDTVAVTDGIPWRLRRTPRYEHRFVLYALLARKRA